MEGEPEEVEESDSVSVANGEREGVVDRLRVRVAMADTLVEPDALGDGERVGDVEGDRVMLTVAEVVAESVSVRVESGVPEGVVDSVSV